MMDEKQLGSRIRDRRNELKMSQTELANAVGLIQAKISQIEIGERKIDMLKELPRFAQILGRPVDWFITEEEIGSAEITLESVLKEKCPSLGKLTDEELIIMKDLCGNILGSFMQLQRNSRISQKEKKRK